MEFYFMSNDNDIPFTISNLLQEHPELKKRPDGLPYMGKRPNSQNFFDEVRKVEEAFYLYGNSDNLLDENLPSPPSEKIRLGGGSPAAFPPFAYAQRKIHEAVDYDKIHEYPLAAGSELARDEFREYLKSIGFQNNNPYQGSKVDENGLCRDNVIFTSAATQGFDLILKLICKENDIVIMTAPNYGLFSFMPERNGARVEVVHLKEENDWLLNPDDLAKKIDILNNKCNTLFKNCKHIPKVKAFVNTNPHNPLGKVMGKQHIPLLEKIGKICRERGVFVIDDLVYRDLTFDRNNIAVPMASLPGNFQNTISLFSTSKSYGLAGIRAGAIVADETLIRGIRNSIFQTFDSISIAQVAAVVGSYNNSPERNKEYNKYFSKIIPEYKFRYNIIKAMVDGIDSIPSSKEKRNITDYIVLLKGKTKAQALLRGIDGVSIASGTEPESGFFTLLDFTSLKNKFYYDMKIQKESDCLKFLYCDNNIKLLPGKSIAWPKSDQIVARITFALERDELVDAMEKIKQSVGRLNDHPHKYVNINLSLLKNINDKSK